jgi:hypothetical protein
MTSRPYVVQPPRVAAWLVSLFTPAEDAESILGDLHEEFSDYASRSGIASARSWYWRQTVTTIAHLVGAAFRFARWSTTAAVVGGYLLGAFFSGLPDKILSVVTDRYLAYWSTHFKAYMFWATDGMLVAHLIASLVVGCIVALASKRRELVVTVALALVHCALIGAAVLWVAAHQRLDVGWMLWSCAIRSRSSLAEQSSECVDQPR